MLTVQSPATLKAVIRNRRPHPSGGSVNGSRICDVSCPRCKRMVVVTYGGWLALACRCGADIYRPTSWAAL